MATFAFIHGAGDVGWYWHRVEAELRARGHDTVAPDLPIEDDEAGLIDYADDGRRRDRRSTRRGRRRPVVRRLRRPDRGRTHRQPADRARRRDDPVGGRIGRGDVREHGLGARAPRGLERPSGLLPGRPAGARRRGPQPRPAAVRHPGSRTVAARGMARHPDPVRPVPERPVLPGAMARAAGPDRGSASSPTRSTAATARRSAAPASSPSCSMAIWIARRPGTRSQGTPARLPRSAAAAGCHPAAAGTSRRARRRTAGCRPG